MDELASLADRRSIGHAGVAGMVAEKRVVHLWVKASFAGYVSGAEP